jgi:hypothetical protein
MQIDRSDEQFEKAMSAMHESRQPDSKATPDRDKQRKKQFGPIVSIDKGIQIDETDQK